MQFSGETMNDLAASPLDSHFIKSIPAEILDHARATGLSLLRTFADRPSYVLGVTSAMAGEGKTTISIGLTEVMGTDFGLDTVLLDVHAERHWPTTDESTAQLGLSDWLSGECELVDAQVNLHDKCTIMPFGSQIITSRDLLQYMVKTDALQQLRQQSSLVLLDLPDLLNPAAPALANLCDGIVLVIRSGETPAEVVKGFLPMLSNVTIHGVILNRHRPAVPATLRRLFA